MILVDFLEQHLFTCSTKSLLGIECPGCGMQRAAIALLKGDLLESLHFNASLLPFVFTLFFTMTHLFFNFKHGAKTIVWLFGLTTIILLGQFVVKLILNH